MFEISLFQERWKSKIHMSSKITCPGQRQQLQLEQVTTTEVFYI